MNVSTANDFQFCREVTRKSASSFYHAFRYLDATQHDALCAIYAFCRFVDDAADESAPEDAPRLVAEWRAELDRCWRGLPTHPVTSAIAASRREFPIPRAALEAIVDGVEMDLGRTRFETWGELELYCRRVASAVGLAAIEIFGYQRPETRDYALHVGLALQLTNILRDVAEDAERGRIYLPLEDLRRFGVTERDILFGVYNRGFRALMAFECDRARAHYRAAEREIRPEDAASLRPAEIMRRTYERVLDQIVAEEYRVFERRIGLSRARKLLLAASFSIGSLRP